MPRLTSGSLPRVPSPVRDGQRAATAPAGPQPLTPALSRTGEGARRVLPCGIGDAGAPHDRTEV